MVYGRTEKETIEVRQLSANKFSRRRHMEKCVWLLSNAATTCSEDNELINRILLSHMNGVLGEGALDSERS